MTMASKELSILLVAKDLASKTIGKVSKEVGGLGRMSRMASRGLSTLAGNLGKLGAVAAVGIAAAVRGGIGSLADLEDGTTSVAGALQQMGLAGVVTAEQVAGWANQIEAATDAAFDDKAITQAASTLIRYGKVSAKNLRPAMVVMTDLAARTGDVESAATLLAKALADPEKAAGKLSKQGIILTKGQQAQIKAMVKAGDVAGAQAVLLRELERITNGAADALHGPYRDALLEFADVTEDGQRVLAVGFLPLLTKLSDRMKTAIADPKVMAGIREFGETLAGGFDSALAIAEKLPWGTIGDSLRLAGAGAKTILGAFSSMPPWVQTAVLTGWGLNKLTGGAISGIVGELGKGLIKGVLGMNAGVVNIITAVVNGAGGGVVGGGNKPGNTSWLATFAKLLGPAALVFALTNAGNDSGRPLPGDTKGQLFEIQREIEGLRRRNPNEQLGVGVNETVGQAIVRLEGYMKTLASGKPLNLNATPKAVVLGPPSPAYAGVIERALARGLTPTKSGIQATLDKNAAEASADVAAADAREATRSATLPASTDKAAAVTAVASRVQQLLQSITNARLAAIAAKDFSPQITVPVSVTSTVTVRGMAVAQRVHASYNGIMVNRPVGRGPLP
jgi:hypothetical protein